VIDIPISVEHLRWPMKLNIPADLALRLEKLFEDPFAWWMGQFQKYYIKPLPKFQTMIDTVTEGYALRSPIACIHVRRSEKSSEAKYVPLQIYMNFVKEYFDQLDLKYPFTPRNVFLAADDPQVFQEARDAFPDYKFITNEKSANMVHLMQNRVGENYMAQTIADFQILAECDFVVTTYSSNYGRRIYEMKYNHFMDANERIVSADMDYFVILQIDIEYKIVQRHVSQNPNVILEVGSVVVFENYWAKLDGMSLWKNEHNGLTRVKFNMFELDVPDYKLERIIYTTDMPNYEQ
jgi:glycoprotein 6-alpha-L-fucosyltransferase